MEGEIMNIRMKATLFSIVLATASVSLAQSTQANRKPSFSITLSTPDGVVKPGSNVMLEVVLKNTSDQDISAGELLGGAELNYDIDVRDSKGDLATETQYGRRIHGKDPNPGHGGSGVARALKPGETQKTKTFLNRVYDLSQPGSYTVQAQTRDPNSNMIVKSNTITFTVTP
jgi:hypothetical protein